MPVLRKWRLNGWLSLLILLNACAQQPGKPLPIYPLAAIPALAAEFITTVRTSADTESPLKVRRWRFWRSAERIETLDLQTHSGEVWLRAANGEISYQRIFHAQRTVIEYTAGDLKAIQAYPDWQALSLLVTAPSSQALIPAGQQTLLQGPTLRYQSPDDPQSGLNWLEHEQLPALIDFNQQQQTLQTQLLAVYSPASAPWAPPDARDYAVIDFADMGDKENDPFIQSIQHTLKGSYAHSH